MSTSDFSTREYRTKQPSAAPSGAADEQTRLEDAMRRADELLVTSLKSDERRRYRRRIMRLAAHRIRQPNDGSLNSPLRSGFRLATEAYRSRTFNEQER